VGSGELQYHRIRLKSNPEGHPVTWALCNQTSRSPETTTLRKNENL